MAETEPVPALGGITDAPEAKENSLLMEELGRYAVDEYNKKAVCGPLMHAPPGTLSVLQSQNPNPNKQHGVLIQIYLFNILLFD